jgi:hypothetical protein
MPSLIFSLSSPGNRKKSGKNEDPYKKNYDRRISYENFLYSAAYYDEKSSSPLSGTREDFPGIHL